MKRSSLWTANFRKLTAASVLGAAGAIAGGYAMRFLVFEQTGSTLAAGFITAASVIPQFILPVLIAPCMDRFPRKPFLVGGDLISGILYGIAGIYLEKHTFSYSGYLIFTIFLSAVGAVDSLAYNSIFPAILPKGSEEKGYTVGGMLYPVMNVLILPLTGFLIQYTTVSRILLFQGAASIGAGLLENRISVPEKHIHSAPSAGLSDWARDLKAGFQFIHREKGLKNIFRYMAFTNGVSSGLSSILVAFFSISPGFTPSMYGFFSFAEFVGRSLGGVFRYRVSIPKKGRVRFVLAVYWIYECMDAALLWLPYPMMLINRMICGFLGFNSATERSAAVQSYIPDEFRARVNAYESAVVSAASAVLAIAVGWVGEFLCPEMAMTVFGVLCLLVCFATVYRNQKALQSIFESY